MVSFLLACFISAEEAGESHGVVISMDLGTVFTCAGVSRNGIDLDILTRTKRALTTSTDSAQPLQKSQKDDLSGICKGTIGFKGGEPDV